MLSAHKLELYILGLVGLLLVRLLSDLCSLLELYSVEEMDYLLENKVQESQSGSFVCLLCGVVIKVRNNLRRHFRLRHVEQRERFRCPPCDKGPSINDVRKILGLFDSTLSLSHSRNLSVIFWTTPDGA